MATNFIQRGDSLVYANTGATTVVPGQLLVIGALVGVSDDSIPPGTDGVAGISGVWRLPKAAEAITQGARVYADADGEISTTASGTFAGVAFAPAAADAPTVDVLLNVGG